MQHTDVKRFFVIAGEASGDMIGAALLRGVLEKWPCEVRGIGGPMMEDVGGFRSTVPFSTLSHLGIGAILGRLPSLLRLMKTTTEHILSWKPDALITIDAPEFCFRVARRVRGRVPRVHCVPPAVWAWRPHRAKRMHPFTDRLLTIFPFEGAYFDGTELPYSFVGHPITERKPGYPERFFARYPEMRGHPILCLLPGSRMSEFDTLLPIFLETRARLQAEVPNMRTVLVTPSAWAEFLSSRCGAEQIPILWTEEDKGDVFSVASAALAASGTVSLELAFHGTPMVIAYKVPAVTAFILKRLITTPHIALINIVAGNRIVPECLQDDCSPDMLKNILFPLLTSREAREEQKSKTRAAIALLKTETPFPNACAEAIALTIGAK